MYSFINIFMFFVLNLVDMEVEILLAVGDRVYIRVARILALIYSISGLLNLAEFHKKFF